LANSLQWKIVFIYILLILLSLQLISVYLVQSLEQYYLTNYKDNLENQARLLSAFIEPGLGESQRWAEDTIQLASGFTELEGMEVIVLDSYAHVIGTSGNQSIVGSRLIRNEITRALSGHLSDDVRYDPVNLERRYYLALPIMDDQNITGVVYLSGSLNPVDETLNEIKTILLTGVSFALVISCLLGIILTRTITVPIKEVTDKANLMARGDFSYKISVYSGDEIGKLGETFNYLADRLSSTIGEMSSERSKVEAIINNMTDGIIALDGKGRLIQINPAARSLIKKLGFKVPQLNKTGFSLLRNLIGQETLRQFLRHQMPVNTEISVQSPLSVMLVKLAPFRIEQGKLDGTLMVLHDITKERELIKRQEEFVADVSHELRTPLTTVKSYIETLLDGASEDPQVSKRFLAILDREADRMVTMVRDLLSLSHMDTYKADWQRTEVNLSELIEETVEQIKRKEDSDVANIIKKIPAKVNDIYADRDKIMRVLSNLLSNAVKYSSSSGTIIVKAYEKESDIYVIIEDDGPGIPPDELPYVFDRFYRVEKTRSRDYGGSGLGLSIARKVVESFGGRIWLESIPGNGTKAIFTIPLGKNIKD